MDTNLGVFLPYQYAILNYQDRYFYVKAFSLGDTSSSGKYVKVQVIREFTPSIGISLELIFSEYDNVTLLYKSSRPLDETIIRKILLEHNLPELLI